MTLRVLVAVVAALSFASLAVSQTKAPTPAPAQTPKPAAPPVLSPAASADLDKRVEAYLRNAYAWGPDFKLKFGPIEAAAGGALYAVNVEITTGGDSGGALVYVTKDGRFLLRGDVNDLSVDPLAAVRKQLHLDGYASKGPANAKVILVEFGDFECPSCRELDIILRQLLPKYPQVRLVFKDFPLEKIHPWALTAALAGHCVLQVGSQQFWKFHDDVYDAQDLITPENAYAKLTELATQAGVPADTFGTCMADPTTKTIVDKSIEEGRNLQITGTPTIYVDGRSLTGPDGTTLKQYVDYDLAPTTPTH